MYTPEEIKKFGATGAVIMDNNNYWHSTIEANSPEELAIEIETDLGELQIGADEDGINEFIVYLTVSKKTFNI
jgi:hypothetical protein